jgi:AraC-like DNA-binding protein
VSDTPGLLVAALVSCCVLAALLVWRERVHRQRVKTLLARLGELDELWKTPTTDAGLHETTDSQTIGSLEYTSTHPSLRGGLSSVISSLWRKAETAPPHPERLDVRAIRFLYSEISEPVTPQQLARQLAASLRTLQRSLAATLGCSPGELILAVKMREAKHRLVSGEWQVQDVARSVGFDDAFHFSRRFRAYYGVPPSQARDNAE